jgi:chromosome segregation ATPase
LQALKAQLASADAALADSQDVVADLQSQLHDAETRIAAATARAEAAEQARNALATEWAASSRELAATQDESQGRLERRIELLSAQLVDAQRSAASALSQLAEERGRVAALTVGARQDSEEAARRLQEFESETERATSEAVSAREAQAMAETLATEIKDRLEQQFSVERRLFQRSVARLEQELAESRQAADRTRCELEVAAQRDANEARSRSESLMAHSLVGSRAQSATVSALATTLQASIGSIPKQQSIHSDVTSAASTASLRAALARRSSLEADCVSLQREIEVAKATLAELETRKSEVAATCASTRQEAEAAERRVLAARGTEEAWAREKTALLAASQDAEARVRAAEAAWRSERAVLVATWTAKVDAFTRALHGTRINSTA